MAKSDFNIDDGSSLENNIVNNKKNFLKNNFSSPEIVYDESSNEGPFGRIKFFFSTINRSVLFFLLFAVIAIIIGAIVIYVLVSAYNNSFKTEIKIPDVVYIGETDAISAISSGTGDLDNTSVTFENELYTEVEDMDEEEIPLESPIELEKDSMKGKELYNTLIPIEEGAAKITVKSRKGARSMGKASKIVYVCPSFNKNLISNGTLSVTVNDEFKIPIDFGYGSCSKGIKYTSSNPDMLKVTKDGKITGLKQGNVNLTISKGERKFSIPVYITGSEVSMTSIKVNTSKIMLAPKENRRLTVSYFPANATSTNSVKYESTNSDVVGIDQYGKIIAYKAGKGSIKVKSGDIDEPVLVDVVVSKEKSKEGSIVTDLILDKEEANLVQGESLKINLVITPDDAKVKTIKYISSDSNVATVSSKGIVYAKNKGTAIITCTTNNELSKNILINVSEIEKPKVLSDDGIISNNWHNRPYKLKLSGGVYGARYYYGLRKNDISRTAREILISHDGIKYIFTKACLYNLCGDEISTLSKLDTKKPKIIKAFTRNRKDGKYLYIAAKDSTSKVNRWCINASENSNKCDWKTIEVKDTVVISQKISAGDYYVFVKDSAGNISDYKNIKVESLLD